MDVLLCVGVLLLEKSGPAQAVGESTPHIAGEWGTYLQLQNARAFG